MAYMIRNRLMAVAFIQEAEESIQAVVEFIQAAVESSQVAVEFIRHTDRHRLTIRLA